MKMLMKNERQTIDRETKGEASGNRQENEICNKNNYQKIGSFDLIRLKLLD